MQFMTEDEPDLTIPEDTIVRARLEEVEYREFEWTDKKSQEKKTGEVLEWHWQVTATDLGEEYIGRKLRGRCNPKLTNRDGNRFRMWAEALLQREIGVGMAIDTDDLVGLEAEVVIGHEPDRKDPSRVWERVTDVIPLSGAYSAEPPF